MSPVGGQPAGEGHPAGEGIVEEILVYPRRRQSGTSLDEVIAIAGQGLEGDHRRSAARSVTVLAREAWEAAMDELNAALPPSRRRANLVVRGIDLAAGLGQRLQIGGAELDIAGETTPCALMEFQRAGLEQALAKDLRGGLFGPVTKTGRIRVGDPVRILR